MERVLITGASGLLGGNLARDYATQFQVFGVFHEHAITIPSVSMIGADLARPEITRMVLGKVRPDLVVHCAAATDVDRCQRDPAWADLLNHTMPRGVARAAHATGAKLIHISTDAVFDGIEGNYGEQARPAPVNTYGKSKLNGEKAVLADCPGALVVRTNLFGWNLMPRKRGLAEWFLNKLESGERCKGFTDVLFSPIHVSHLGEALLDLAESGTQGVLHVGGRTCLSKFEFGQLLAHAFSLDSDLIEHSSVDEGSLGAARPKRICLDSSSAERHLGRDLPDIHRGIDLLVRQQLRAAPGENGPTEKARMRS